MDGPSLGRRRDLGFSHWVFTVFHLAAAAAEAVGSARAGARACIGGRGPPNEHAAIQTARASRCRADGSGAAAACIVDLTTCL